jgi:hypothetical protein
VAEGEGVMEAMVAFGLVLGFLVGGMMLALAMGYRSTEEARAREKKLQLHHGQVARAAQAIPSFFAASDRGELPGLLGFDEVLLGRLESHVREEQALVSEFVHYPSIHSLYRQAPQSLRMH